METIKDENAPIEQLAIVEKYEKFINYMYPVAQNVPRKHGCARELFLRAMLDTEILRRTLNAMRAVSKERLGLKLSKWTIAPVTRGVNFLGYRIWPKHKLLRRSSVTRAKRAIKSLREGGDEEALSRFLSAWTGHAGWADSHNLLSYLEIEHENREQTISAVVAGQ